MLETEQTQVCGACNWSVGASFEESVHDGWKHTTYHKSADHLVYGTFSLCPACYTLYSVLWDRRAKDELAA